MQIKILSQGYSVGCGIHGHVRSRHTVCRFVRHGSRKRDERIRSVTSASDSDSAQAAECRGEPPALPPRKTSRTTELPVMLFNQLVGLLETEFPSARWHRGSLLTDAQPMLEAMAAVLSYLQGSAEQLAKRTARLPASLMPLTRVKVPGGSGNHKKAIVLEHVVDDPKQPKDHQNPVPSETRERFYQAYCKLLQCLHQPWATRPEFHDFASEAWLLAKVITGYYEENTKGAAAQRARAKATVPSRPPGDESCTRAVVFRNRGECPPLFGALWKALEESEPFTPLIVDPFVPEGPERYSFLRQLTVADGPLTFPSAAYLYQHYTGNRQLASSFI
jgi:hypothetical protein